MRKLARKIAYDSGLLSAIHHRRNRSALTVVMFHRVLPETDPRWNDADPEWTVPEQLFEDCLRFFRRHYHLIGLEQLAQTEAGRQSLPERPLLITFDDGWADNEEYALKLLRRAGAPAAVFVSAGAVGSAELWQERVRRAWRRGGPAQDAVRQLWTRLDGLRPPEAKLGLQTLLRTLTEMDPNGRDELLSGLRKVLPPSTRPHMITLQQLRHLRAAGMSIGSHGVTHDPLPLVPDLLGELLGSRRLLAQMLGDEKGPVALSFPHGAYNAAAVRTARAAGFQLLFTSDPCLNELDGNGCPGPLLGRIPILAREVADRLGRANPDQLAAWLFRRPSRTLQAAP